MIEVLGKDNISVIVDVVLNHVGPLISEDFSSLIPFNDISSYHTALDKIDQLDYLYNQENVRKR